MASFDSVHRKETWNGLQAKWVPNRLTQAIRKVYHEPKGNVRLDGEKSVNFETKKGIKQCDRVSHLLFTIYVMKFTKYARDEQSQWDIEV